MMDTILAWMAHPGVRTLLAAGAALALGWFKRREALRGEAARTAFACLEAGVRHAYETFVRGCKKRNADGKLSEAERREAMATALGEAGRLAARQGLDLARVHAEEALPALVERIVRRARRGG